MNWAFPPTFGAQQIGCYSFGMLWRGAIGPRRRKILRCQWSPTMYVSRHVWVEMEQSQFPKTCSFTFIEHSFCLCNRVASAAYQLVCTTTTWIPRCIGITQHPASWLKGQGHDQTTCHGAAWAWWGQALPFITLHQGESRLHNSQEMQR